MANVVYRMTLGTDLVSATGVGWQIAGIQIDNPSGSWLLVKGIEQYVPPYVRGWSAPMSPMQASVSVRFVDSPSGSQSALVGSPPVVTIFDTPLPSFAGSPTGAGARVTTMPLYESAFDILLIVAVPQTILNIPGSDLMIRRLAIQPSWQSPVPILMNITVEWFVAPPPAAPYQPFAWFQTLAPEGATYVSDTFEDGAAFVQNGGTLQADMIYEIIGYYPGPNFPQVLIEAQFYREVPR